MSELTRVINQLEAHGHRLTASRLAVLSEEYALQDQFSADDIHRNLPRVGRATIFRTIKLLVDESVVCRVLLDDGRLLYKWSSSGHHHHMICRVCGTVKDLSGCGIELVLAETLNSASFSMDGHWLEVYGRCNPCRDSVGA